MAIDPKSVRETVEGRWEVALPVLEHYVSIPAKSPAFDRDWQANGHIGAAVELVRDWCVGNAPPGSEVTVHRLEGLTPVVTVDVPASDGVDRDDTVVIYGHIDKQPEMAGWREDLGPWSPVLEGDRLYGRGGADDGYSVFAALSAIEAVREAGGRHGRCIVLIEASEESGSIHLPAHLDALGPLLGNVSMVVCLDSGAPDYAALWLTTSLRGIINAELSVQVLERGFHSGIVGGVAPSSFRIIRRLLDRVEDAETGRLLLDELNVRIPENRIAEARAAADAGVDPRADIAFHAGTRSDSDGAFEALVDTCWRPAMATIAAGGLPSLDDGGNVLRPLTTLGLSFRLPPTCSPDRAADALRRALTEDVPKEAEATFVVNESAAGWNAEPTAPWLEQALAEASIEHFGRPAGSWGLGASIPFMAMLGDRYPHAQFVITGALGPESNAHGPNEFLHLPTARRISACVAHVLDAHARS
jgi:acetylornithine deacetylase/succinyl-diaminopimelate desuccinylase-like protein